MPVISFTPAFINTGLVCPPDKQRIEYSVADEPGLFVECRASPSFSTRRCFPANRPVSRAQVLDS